MKQRRMRSIPAGYAAPAAAPNIADQVSQVLASGTAHKSSRSGKGWSRTTVTIGLRFAAALLGVYLSYSVLRLQELYPALNVDRLPMYMSIVILAIILVSTPPLGWRTLWREVPAARWQALLVVLSVITAPVGIWMAGSLNAAIFKYSLSVIVFIATALLLRDRKAMATALTILLLAATAVGMYSLSDSAKTVHKTDRVKLGVTLDPNDLAQILVALMPLGLYMAQRKGGRSLQWLIAAVVLTVAVAPTESRGGILGLGAVALTLISFGTTRWKKILNMIIVVGGAVGIAAIAGPDSRMTEFSDYEGGEGRIAIWKRGLVWMSWRPWGFGMDNFPIFFDWMNGRERAAHNSWIQIGVELGVLALLAFSAMWFTLARQLLRQRRVSVALRGKLPGAEAEAVLATMVLAAMAGTAASGFFIAKAYASVTLFILGIATATVLGFPFSEHLPPSGARAGIPNSPANTGLRRR